MRKLLLLTSLAALAGPMLFAVPAQTGQDVQKRYRLRRLSDATTMASPPAFLLTTTEECPILPGAPEVIGPNFDPANYDEISLAGSGRLVAYATLVSLASPGRKAIVVQREGNDSVTVSEGGADNDQPSIDIDALGWRMAFRGPGGSANGGTDTDIYLYTHTSRTDGLPRSSETPTFPVIETKNITDFASNLTGTFARDPSLAARTKVSEFDDTDITFVERDARLAFISDGDFDKGARKPADSDPGRNPDGLEQLFVWREMDRRFTQITRNTEDGATLARPSMSGDGRSIAFEATADLVPDAVNPRDPAVVGNPDGVRQIYLWRSNRKGGRIRQLTFGTTDSFAPRIAPNGSSVLFCSKADLLPGANPEGNFEIFRWRRGVPKSKRLAQLTQTQQGDSVLPRQMRNRRQFVFYSTAAPPDTDTDFGQGIRQCGPTALLYTRGRVRLVGGLFDSEQDLTPEGSSEIDPSLLIFVGPPAARSFTKIHFATNDPLIDPAPTLDDDGNPVDAPGTATTLMHHLGRATRFSRR